MEMMSGILLTPKGRFGALEVRGLVAWSFSAGAFAITVLKILERVVYYQNSYIERVAQVSAEILIWCLQEIFAFVDVFGFGLVGGFSFSFSFSISERIS